MAAINSRRVVRSPGLVQDKYKTGTENDHQEAGVHPLEADQA
jgi:hypothetical protein